MMIQYKSSIHCQDTKQNLLFIQRKNENSSTKSSNLNYLDTKFNARKSNIPYDSKAVITGLYEKFNSYIRTILKIKHPHKPLSKYIFPK